MEDAAARTALSWDADRRAAGWIDKPFIERFLSVLPPALLCLILAVEAVRRLHFTWLRRAFASPAWTAPRRSSRYAEPGFRIRSGSSATCALWPSAAIWRHIGLG